MDQVRLGRSNLQVSGTWELGGIGARPTRRPASRGHPGRGAASTSRGRRLLRAGGTDLHRPRTPRQKRRIGDGRRPLGHVRLTWSVVAAYLAMAVLHAAFDTFGSIVGYAFVSLVGLVPLIWMWRRAARVGASLEEHHGL